MRRIVYKAFVLMFLFSCQDRYDVPDYKEQYVVEGMIGAGESPVVIITRTMPFVVLDEKVLMNYVSMTAVVTVTTEEGEVHWLHGERNDNYLPPYIYTDSLLKGEVGKRYKLSVSTFLRQLTAETVIPSDSVHVVSTRIEQTEEDTLYRVKIYFEDNEEEDNNYKLFTSVRGKEEVFLPSFLGTFDDSAIVRDSCNVTAYRAYYYGNKELYTPYFTSGDTVSIRFEQIGREAFDFWSTYEGSVNFSSNVFFPMKENLPTNIEGRGFGVWYGYNATMVNVVIP